MRKKDRDSVRLKLQITINKGKATQTNPLKVNPETNK